MDTPTVKERWYRLCKGLGLGGEAMWIEFETAYLTSGRAYHNLGHIVDCLQLLDEHRSLAIDPTAVELSVWFHDVVYDTRMQDNETISAGMAGEFLVGTRFEHEVPRLILATRHDGTPGSPDARLLCDIDISILGAPPARYH